jgi:hypothetical protein
MAHDEALPQSLHSTLNCHRNRTERPLVTAANAMLCKHLINIIRWRVAAGPFQGTRCEVTESGDGVVAKLAGCYEQEIYPAFKEAVGRRPAVVADIGGAEGFYVAALARALPESRVIAYEAKPEWQQRIRHVASLNGVEERCEIRGLCDVTEFRRLLEETRGRRMFTLMDIEGGEFGLLTRDMAPLLRDVEMLVELHEPNNRTAGDALVSMLAATHQVEVIWAKEERTPADISSRGWRLAARLLLPVRHRLHEGRAYQMRWIHAVPKSTSEKPSAESGPGKGLD